MNEFLYFYSIKPFMNGMDLDFKGLLVCSTRVAHNNKQSMDRALSQLSRAVAGNDHSAVIQFANEVVNLSANTKHDLALECKVVALLNLGQFDEAARVAESIGGFLYAYALYRAKKNEDARKVKLDDSGENRDAILHLKAQIVSRANCLF
jgi:hypothetical protein